MNLMFGCLGNGVTVCDRDRTEHGDYKNIAHIDPCGAVRMYVKTISPEARETIERHAALLRDVYREGFMRMNRERAVDEVYDRMTIPQWLEHRDLWQMDREALYALYIETVCANDHRTMPEHG